MSISKFQDKFLSKGCFTAFAVVAAVAMAASMFSNRMTNAASPGEERERAANGKAVATVDGVGVGKDAIQRSADSVVQRLSVGGPLDPTIQAVALARATDGAIRQAALQSLVSKAGVTDADVTAAASAAVERDLAGVRADLVQKGKLKANASEAEFEAALKPGLGGRTLAQLRADTPKEALARFKDPAQRAGILAAIGQDLLARHYGAKALGDDQALRDSYRSYVVRRIFLSAASGAKETPEARAQKALADLKAGKSFESEMDAVSNDPPNVGKKLHDSTETVPASSLAARAELAGLVGKSPNATTPVVDVPGGKAIYQLVSVKDDLPKDFEAKKAKYREARIAGLGQAEAERQLKALTSGAAVQWNSPGYKALSAASQAVQSLGSTLLILDPAADRAAIEAGEAALKAADPSERKLGAQALLIATNPRFLATKSPEASASRRAALEAAFANGVEDGALRLELAGLYGDAKDGAKATDALVEASKNNDDYATKGQQTFSDIAAKALDLRKKGVLTQVQLDSVQAQQAVWTAARAASAKAATTTKASAASDDAANAAEIARQKAEAQGGAVAPKGSAPANVEKENAAEIARQKTSGKTGAGR